MKLAIAPLALSLSLSLSLAACSLYGSDDGTGTADPTPPVSGSPGSVKAPATGGGSGSGSASGTGSGSASSPSSGAGSGTDPGSSGSPGTPPAGPGIVAADPCDGHWENEPNDNNPQHLDVFTCGHVDPADIDKFAFDVHQNNPFVLRITADGNVRTEIDSPCINRHVVTGTDERVRLTPDRDCTIHVTVTAPAVQTYQIHRDK